MPIEIIIIVNTYDSNLNRTRQMRTKKYINNKNIFDYSENDIKYNTNLSTINVNRFSFCSYINNNLENLANELNILTQGTNNIFCYFRIYKKIILK